MGLTTGGSTVVSNVKPVAPISPTRLQIPKASGQVKVNHNLVRAVIGRMPPPSQPAPDPLMQAQQLVQREVSPLEAQITGMYTNEGKAGAQAIQQLTDEYAQRIGQIGPQISNSYNTAEQGTALADQSLADRLSGAGNQESQDLAARLASINEPNAVNPAVATVASNAAGAGNALYGTGNAVLDQLIGQAAHAAQFSSTLPGIARDTGIQSLGQYEGQLAQAQGKDVAALNDKIPGLINSVYGTISSARNQAANRTAASQRTAATIKAENARTGATINAENQRTNANNSVKQAQLIEKGREFDATAKQKQAAADFLNWYRGASVKQRQQGLQQKAAQFQASLGEKTRHDQTLEQQGDTRLKLETFNANTSRIRANTASAKAAQAAQPKINSSVSRSLGYAADQYGNPIGKTLHVLPGYKIDQTGHVVKSSSGGVNASRNGFSAKDYAKLDGQALAGAQQSIKQGDSYETALRNAEEAGIPAWIVLPRLNQVYKAGFQGRPQAGFTIHSKGPLGVTATQPATPGY